MAYVASYCMDLFWEGKSPKKDRIVYKEVETVEEGEKWIMEENKNGMVFHAGVYDKDTGEKVFPE